MNACHSKKSFILAEDEWADLGNPYNFARYFHVLAGLLRAFVAHPVIIAVDEGSWDFPLGCTVNTTNPIHPSAQEKHAMQLER